jgi:replicative DNA helicase
VTAVPADDPMLAAALGYAAKGWRVIPIRPGGKHPAGIDAWQKAASNDPGTVRSWWTGLYRGHGVGIATGPESGIFVLDVDNGPGKTGDDSLADLEATYGKLPDTVEVITGSGGRHLYFAWPDGADIRNDQAGKLGPFLDIRGEGGQVLAPPTVHPNGRRYEPEASSPDEPAPAPAWLVKLLTAPGADSKPRRERIERPDGAELPGDRFAVAVTWPQLLEATGATYLGQRIERETGERYELWARPAMPLEEGYTPHTSATLYYKGSDVLKVFTPNWRGVTDDGEIWELTEGDTYTRFGFYATVWHGGDFAAATRQAAEDYGDSIADAEADLGAMGAATATDDTPADDWDAPVALGADVVPPFPLRVLPAFMAEFCADVAHTVQTPTDLPAMLAIGALATVATGKIEVEVAAGWVEPCNLFLAGASPPGGGKSPAFSATFGPLKDLEERLRVAARREIAEAEARKKLLEKKLRDAEKSGNANEMIEATIALADLHVPAPPRLMADDQTPEAFTNLLHLHGRIAIVSPEGGLFGMLNRYTEGKEAQLDPYLKVWSGDDITIDRKGEPEPKIIRKPLATVCLTVQPDTLVELGNRKDFTGRGLPQRFMYAIPPSIVGERDLSTPRDADQRVRQAWAERIVEIGERLARHQHPKRLRLSAEAWVHFGGWRQQLEQHRGQGGDLEHLAEWTAKLESSVLRLAALLWLAGDAEGDTVGADHMAKAIEVGGYWIAHAKAVWDTFKANPDVDNARQILKMAARKDWTTLRARDVMRANRKRFADTPTTERAIKVLLEHGWVRPDEQDRRLFHLHPDATAVRRGTTGTTDSVENLAPEDVDTDLSTESVVPVVPFPKKTKFNTSSSYSDEEAGNPENGTTGTTLGPDEIAATERRHHPPSSPSYDDVPTELVW